MAQDEMISVNSGDRYYRVGQHNSVWIVKQVMFSENQSIPHVMIEKHGVAGETDIIPLYVLEDPSNYRPDRRALEPAAPAGPRRRATDRQNETV